MRVAIVTENFLPKLDGVTRTLSMLLQHLQQRGHRAMVLGPRGAPARYAGARVYGAPGLPLPIYRELRMLYPAPALRRQLARFRPDVVHVVDPMLLGAAGIQWAERLDAPIVSSYHTNLAAYCAHYHLGMLAAPTWAYRRFLHNRCAATLCPSRSTAKRLEQYGFARVGVWPRGVDTQLFTPSRRSEAWRIRVAGEAARKIILYVGRLSPEKNLGALVEAFRQLAVHDASLHLVLVGDGPCRRDLERALAGQRVTFTGYLHGDALAEAYASADVFTFPSTTETFGQVIQEAMASGVPVVAFNAEGAGDLVSHRETGLLVPAGDVPSFAHAVHELLASPEQRQQIGAQGRAVATQRRWDRVLDDSLDVYRHAIADHALDRAA